MLILRDWQSCPEQARSMVLAIGNFDGLHLGHQAVLKEAGRVAQEHGAKLAVLTFEPHPRMFFTNSVQEIRIQPFRDKVAGFVALGASAVFAIRFNRKLSEMSAAEFIEKVLIGSFAAVHVVTGEDFVFGKGRLGNSALLRSYAEKGVFGYTPVGMITGDGERFSSTRLRRFVAAGDMLSCRRAMGRFYALNGRVTHGDARGAAIGFPTANINTPPGIITPAHGVYACLAEVDGVKYRAVCNYGRKPTFGDNAPVLEVHIMDYKDDLYGRCVTVHFVERIRDEMKFPSVDALITQIRSDIEKAVEILAHSS